MISRHWTGICKKENSEDYIKHLQNTTLPALKAYKGFISATVFHREVLSGTEFLVTTLWSSKDAIREFTGLNAELAVVPDIVKPMMVQFDEFAATTERKAAVPHTRSSTRTRR